ncbi:MAG: hypothetical protein EOO27_21470 [Comamonadaceae bacterium]|nr:MAG: hypothetical protein EOO27_21470 [Comamonadaceae bacterium]
MDAVSIAVASGQSLDEISRASDSVVDSYLIGAIGIRRSLREDFSMISALIQYGYLKSLDTPTPQFRDEFRARVRARLEK